MERDPAVHTAGDGDGSDVVAERHGDVALSAESCGVGAGPRATKDLADNGALVVKIESRKRLDLGRLSPPFKDGMRDPNGSAFFAQTNTGKRSIDRLVLRVDFRDASGKYQASVPALELKGPLKSGDSGRTTQLLPLNPQYQQAILDTGTAQISAAPAQIVFADGEKIEPGEQLKALETLSRAKTA